MIHTILDPTVKRIQKELRYIAKWKLGFIFFYNQKLLIHQGYIILLEVRCEIWMKR